MTLATPSTETLRHLLERLRANDVMWFRDRFAAGDLAWLRDLLPGGAYDEMGRHIEAGDLDWLRLRVGLLPILRESGLELATYGLRATAAIVAPAAATRAAAIKVARMRGLWIIPLLLIGAIASAFVLARINRNDDDDGATTAVATKVPAQLAVVSTEAPVTEVTAPVTAVPAPETAVPATTAAPAPTADLLATATAAGQFTTLGKAIEAAGLTDTLKGPGPFTVFAPTDEAFAKLPPGVLDALLKPENKNILAKVLTYHIVPGKVGSGDVKDGPVTTVEGSTLDAAHAGTTLAVNTANVTKGDIESSNGLIHVIDAVLLPPDVDIQAILGPAAPATTTSTPAPVNAAGDAVAEDLTVYFANGSAAIDAEGQAKIVGAAAILAKLANGAKVDVVGHASATGNSAFNKTLSERRAAAVEAALKVKLGPQAANITLATSAKGDTEPVADEAKSRRVTVEIKAQ